MNYIDDYMLYNILSYIRIVLWIGLSDIVSEKNFVWDSTGKKLSPGYMGWARLHPTNVNCGGDTLDCVAYNISNTLPAWVDRPCASNFSGICELQPANSSNRRSTQQGDAVLISRPYFFKTLIYQQLKYLWRKSLSLNYPDHPMNGSSQQIWIIFSTLVSSLLKIPIL